MSYMPPGQTGPSAPVPPLVKRLIRLVLILIAIPVGAFLFFLGAVLIYYLFHGPIRWN